MRKAGRVIRPVAGEPTGRSLQASRAFLPGPARSSGAGDEGTGRRLPLTQLSFQVQVDDDDFVHLRVFESLPHENKPLTLSSYQTNKSRHDELTYF